MRAFVLAVAVCAAAVTVGPPIVAQDAAAPRIPPRLRAMAAAGRRVRVIVGLKTGVDGNAVIARGAQGAFRGIRRFRTIPFFAADASPEALAQLERDGGVATIEEDAADVVSLAQSVPLVGAPAAWALGFSGTGWAIAIVDTGVDGSHPFLDGKVVSEACYSNAGGTGGGIPLCPGGATASTDAGSAAPCAGYPGCDHGTHVAGIAAGRGASVSGVARDASIVALQAFTAFPANSLCGPSACIVSFISDQILALERVMATHDVSHFASVNMSLGGSVIYSDTASCDAANPSRKAAIDNLRALDIATVISAGNDGRVDGLTAPGCISSAISVGSTTKADVVSSFSNAAAFLSLLAPGESIVSSIPGGGFASFSGTSMAAPHVAGAWALMKSRRPDATVQEILAALRNTGRSIDDERSGAPAIFPRIQVDQAIAALDTMRMSLDTPVANAQVAPTFTVAGWALAATAQIGTGVDTVHVWAFPADGGSPIFLGVAPYGGARPDVGAVYGTRFTDSGFHLTASGLSPGQYYVAAYAHSAEGHAFNASANALVTVRPAGDPAMNIDMPAASPGNEVQLASPFTVAGWAVDLDSTAGPGVDAIHVWAFPEAGGAPIFAGVAPYGGARPDVGSAFGSRFTPSSYQLVVSGLAPGRYVLGVYAHSTVTGTFNQSAAIAITILP